MNVAAAGADHVIRLIPLEHVRAENVLPLLRSLVPQSSYLAAHARSNSLLVSDRAASVRRLEAVIQRLDDPLLDLARELEEAALEEEFFLERGIYPNVDFYSGILYRAMGIPTEMFTVMFALGRLPGWIGQWKEMRDDPDQRIHRPRQIYQGATERSYRPIDERG